MRAGSACGPMRTEPPKRERSVRWGPSTVGVGNEKCKHDRGDRADRDGERRFSDHFLRSHRHHCCSESDDDENRQRRQPVHLIPLAGAAGSGHRKMPAMVPMALMPITAVATQPTLRSGPVTVNSPITFGFAAINNMVTITGTETTPLRTAAQ